MLSSILISLLKTLDLLYIVSIRLSRITLGTWALELIFRISCALVFISLTSPVIFIAISPSWTLLIMDSLSKRSNAIWFGSRPNIAFFIFLASILAPKIDTIKVKKSIGNILFVYFFISYSISPAKIPTDTAPTCSPS